MISVLNCMLMMLKSIQSSFNDVNSGDALQSALYNLCDWCVKWQMTINVNKCFVLTLGQSSVTFYTINNKLLPVSNVVNDLGVCVDTKLLFCYHYNNIVAKSHQRASLILKCFQCRDPVVLFHAFVTFVRPILEYCSPVWSPVYNYDRSN